VKSRYLSSKGGQEGEGGRVLPCRRSERGGKSTFESSQVFGGKGDSLDEGEWLRRRGRGVCEASRTQLIVFTVPGWFELRKGGVVV